jgi:hypothetical protein
MNIEFDDYETCAYCKTNMAGLGCTETGEDYCSHTCRNKAIEKFRLECEHERIAEITSGSQV